MEKVEKSTKTIEERKHLFYCDECGEFLGETYEHEDGWYPEKGEFELRLYVDGWLAIDKHLCDECRKNLIENIRSVLKNIGFSKW